MEAISLYCRLNVAVCASSC